MARLLDTSVVVPLLEALLLLLLLVLAITELKQEGMVVRTLGKERSPHGGLGHGEREGSENTAPGAPAFFCNLFGTFYR